MEKTFVIAKCVRCGRLLLSRSEVKTKTCPYCNARFGLDKAMIIGCAKSAQEGRQMLSELKKTQAEAH